MVPRTELAFRKCLTSLYYPEGDFRYLLDMKVSCKFYSQANWKIIERKLHGPVTGSSSLSKSQCQVTLGLNCCQSNLIRKSIKFFKCSDCLLLGD